MADSTQRTIIDGVDFQQIVRWPRIFCAITASLQPGRLVLCVFLIALLLGVGQLWDSVTTPVVRPQGILAGTVTPSERDANQRILARAVGRYDIDGAEVSVAVDSDDETAADRYDGVLVVDAVRSAHLARRADLGPTERDMEDRAYAVLAAELESLRPRGVFEASTRHVSAAFVRAIQALIAVDLLEAGGHAHAIFIALPAALARDHLAFLIIYGLFAVIVFALGGAAICRIAACQYAGELRLPLRRAIDFSLGHWVTVVLTPLLPLLLAAGLAVLVLLMGLLMLVPIVNIIGGLGYGIALMFGLVLGLMLIAYIAGFPMLLPALACENCGAGDAMQRSFAYVLQRPLHLLGYLLVAIAALVLGYLLTATIASVILNVTATLYGAFTDTTALSAAGNVSVFDLAPAGRAATIHDNWHAEIAAGLIRFWEALVVLCVAAYVLAFVYDASTVVYLLMRRAADGQDMEDIWQPALAPGVQPSAPAVSAAPAHEA